MTFEREKETKIMIICCHVMVIQRMFAFFFNLICLCEIKATLRHEDGQITQTNKQTNKQENCEAKVLALRLSTDTLANI